MKKQQSGFTLIELIMVIVILGVLSAFALPKFADLGSDADAAAFSGLEGSIKSASGIVRATTLAKGNPATVDLEGQTFTLVNGYLDVDEVELAAGFSCTEFDCLTNGFALAGSADGDNCIYFQNATATAPVEIARNTITGGDCPDPTP